MPTTFYRICKNNPPTHWDMQSNNERGNTPNSHDLVYLRLWDGVSVFDDLAQATKRARSRPRLGSYVARLELPEDSGVRAEKTGGKAHWTLWPDGRDMLTFVTDVISV